MSERFPKSLRLRTRPEFLRVQEQGRKLSAGPLLALALRSPESTGRLGITVTNKVGNAVVRVKLRRRLRELYRKSRARIPSGLDLVLVARNSAKDVSFAELSLAFDTILKQLARTFP